MRSNVTQCFSGLEVIVGQTKEEICEVGARPNRGGRTVECVIAIYIKGIVCVVLVGGKEKTALHGVFAFYPRDIVIVSENVIGITGRTIYARPDAKSCLVERKVGWASCQVWGNLDS